MYETPTSKFADTVKVLGPPDIDISPAIYKYGLKLFIPKRSTTPLPNNTLTQDILHI